MPVRTAQLFLLALLQLKYHMVTGYGPTEKGTTSTKDEQKIASIFVSYLNRSAKFAY